jgi:hypothetical protein
MPRNSCAQSQDVLFTKVNEPACEIGNKSIARREIEKGQAEGASAAKPEGYVLQLVEQQVAENAVPACAGYSDRKKFRMSCFCELVRALKPAMDAFASELVLECA